MASLETANQRTYEPSLRELTSQVSALEKLLEARVKNISDIMNERHQLYKERSDAAEKAIIKAEEAQKAYNASHNDLARKMESQYSLMMPRTESHMKWASFDRETEDLRKDVINNREGYQKDVSALRNEIMKEVQGLRESRSAGIGGEEAHSVGVARGQWLIYMALVGLSSLASLGLGLFAALRK